LEIIECPLDRDYHEDPFTSFLFWNESTTDFLEGIETVTPFLEESVGVSTSPSSPFLEREGMREDLSLTPSPTILEEKGERVESMSDSSFFNGKGLRWLTYFCKSHHFLLLYPFFRGSKIGREVPLFFGKSYAALLIYFFR